MSFRLTDSSKSILHVAPISFVSGRDCEFSLLHD